LFRAQLCRPVNLSLKGPGAVCWVARERGAASRGEGSRESERLRLSLG
jgi:hypothetical protein